MRNLLKLHEAIAVVLLTKPNKTATFEEVAQEIERRRLFPERKGGISLSEQIKLRTSISSSRYRYLFTYQKPNVLTLK
jgi:hypothetical protein